MTEGGQPSEAHAGESDERWRAEVLDLLHQALARLDAASGSGSRIHVQAEPERRWPVSAAVAAAVVLQGLLSPKLALQPQWLLPGLEIALFLALTVANPVRFERHGPMLRAGSIGVIVLVTAANAVSAGLLIRAIVTSHVNSLHHGPVVLLASGAAIWGTNVIAFALWYWEFDRGGPVHRLQGVRPYPDLMFPQMTAPELAPPGWGPRFADYLYLSFTNATAFSPTDVMPLARWAKVTMAIQAAVSLALGALVIARAVNIL